MSKAIRRAVAVAVTLALLLSGCAAGTRQFETAEELVAAGNYDQAVVNFSQALRKKPDSQYYRLKLEEARLLAARFHLEEGRRLMAEGREDAAGDQFQLALQYNPALEVAAQEFERSQQRIRAKRLLEDAEQFFRARKFTQAKQVLNRVLELDPANRQAEELLAKVKKSRITVIDGQELEVTSDKPITLKFKEANLQDVFNILSQLSGVNFLFDEELGNEKITVYLEGATFAQALELLLKMNDLAHKVLNPRTILLYAKTKDKEKQYEDQVIQTFYLSNIDAKKAVNLLRTMLQLRKIFVHEELNALVIRDTPSVVRLSQQILEAADRADSEVVFDVELIEVSRGDDTTLGAQLNAYSIGIGLAKKGGSTIVANSLSSGTATSNLVDGLGSLETFYTLPAATFDFAKTLTDTELLASPKIRVKNKEKAKVHIGSREPVITVTINGDNRSDNVQYVDVGVKLNVEPTVQLDSSVITKLSLEVSSISDRRTLESGSSVFTITTTNAESVLSLNDGERTVIGGLIRDTKSKTTRSIPVLGDLPLVGELFTHRRTDDQKRELLLSITPHIVKNVEMPLADVSTIWSGGEEELKVGPNFGAFLPDFAPELEKGNPAPAPRLVEPRPVDLPQPEAAGEEPAVPPPAVSRPQAAPPRPASPEPPAAVTAPAPASEPTMARSPQPVTAAVPRPPAPVPAPTAVPDAMAPPEVPVLAVAPLDIAGEPQSGRLYISGPRQVGQGEVAALAVNVAGVQNLYSAPLYITYDPAKLEFLRSREGAFLKQGNKPTIFTTSAGARPGLVIVGYKQGTGGWGVSGAGELFTLEFRAIEKGTTEVGMERINFRNPSGERLPVIPEATTLEIR